jgi:hypothetical protein
LSAVAHGQQWRAASNHAGESTRSGFLTRMMELAALIGALSIVTADEITVRLFGCRVAHGCFCVTFSAE